MKRSLALRCILASLRRIKRQGLKKTAFCFFMLIVVLPLALLAYVITFSIHPYDHLKKTMTEPKTVAVVPGTNVSFVVMDMMNLRSQQVQRWLYVRYPADRSDEELGYVQIWPDPGIAGVEPLNTSTWVANHIGIPTGEMCNDIMIMMKMSNATGLKRLAFGLNTGVLHSFHGSMLTDQGTMTTIEESPELIQVARKWFWLAENATNPVVHASYGDWIDQAYGKDTTYDQIIVRVREENDGNLVYYPSRVFSATEQVKRLHSIMHEEGYIVVFISHRSTDQALQILNTYKTFFGAHCALIEPAKTKNNYLFCQKTGDGKQFEAMHQGVLKLIDTVC